VSNLYAHYFSLPVSTEMTRTLSKEKQENVRSMLQRGCGHRKITRILNVSMGSVHNIKKTYLPNVSRLRGGRPRLLNTEMQRSCVLQLTRG
jgi:transposase